MNGNPAEILALIAFAEQLAALAAKTVADIRNVIEGSATKKISELLDDADATYQQVIANAKQSLPPDIITSAQPPDAGTQ